ncbi:hypothetical protein NQ318_000165 [Aromia moschata]|uniref:CIDE-N domain-containing protein n=1 Tax=Aromia moschata TaxID=1265417 RepID=A0AAV8YLK8_9CUCU|nr:hypothetical protein NQ318_000165 [Aromia moschata]
MCQEGGNSDLRPLNILNESHFIRMEDANNQAGKPFKITNVTREVKKGVVATSLEDLTSKVLEKLNIEGEITVVLEDDGTEIDDEEYFATLDPNTSLMVLTTEQNWLPSAPACRLNSDQVDDGKGGTELAGLVDKIFLEQLKEASGRFLCEKRQAQDAMDLLRLYQEKEAESGGTN